MVCRQCLTGYRSISLECSGRLRTASPTSALRMDYALAFLFPIVLALSASLPACGPKLPSTECCQKRRRFLQRHSAPTKVPAGVILVKGAWSSASDSMTPVPEGGNVTDNVFRDQYFGMTYALPKDWTEKYKGPPPSDSGRYVLAQIRPADTFKGPARGSILITAEDMFFTTLPAANALDLINYSKDNLQADYKLELPPTPTKIAGRPFTFFAYWSPVAELHWYVSGDRNPLPRGGDCADQP